MKFVNAGKIVWVRFRVAYLALMEQKERLQVHRAMGRPGCEPFLYELFVDSAYMKKTRGKPGVQWELTRGAFVDKMVDDDEMIVLRVDASLETGKPL